MSASPVDKDQIRYLATQICKIRLKDARIKAVKDLAIKHGGLRRVVFEDALRDEVLRMWIGRKG